MLYRTFLVLMLGLAAAWPQATIPDSPVGRTFKAWLGAFNSGDRAQMEAYCQKYDKNQSAEGMMSFRNMTGGFELLQVLNSDRLHIEFLVKERDSDTRAFGSLDVKDAEPAEVIQFGLRAVPPGTSVSDATFKIDAATRARVIQNAVAKLNESCVFPDVAKQMQEAVETKQKRLRRQGGDGMRHRDQSQRDSAVFERTERRLAEDLSEPWTKEVDQLLKDAALVVNVPSSGVRDHAVTGLWHFSQRNRNRNKVSFTMALVMAG